jgi:single-strand DNA-binding protein
MKTKNRVEIRGVVGREPETNQTSSGTSITRFSVATTERWKGKDEQTHQRTEWHRVVFFGPQAKQLAEFLHKGSFVEIEGSIRSHSYEKDGVKRFSFEVRGSDYALLDRRPGAEDGLPTGAEPPPADSPVDEDVPL